MTARRLSRQDLIRQRREAGFVGRRGELAVFRDNLTRDVADPDYQFLFHVHGHAGVGKTSLVRQWEKLAREHDAVTAYIGDDVHSPVEAMESIAHQLAAKDRRLKTFEKRLAVYRQRRHEAAAPAPAGPAPADASPGAGLAAQLGLGAASFLPGVGALTAAVDPQQVAQGLDRLRAQLSSRLRDHEDVQLVMTPVPVLTPVFAADLGEVAAQHRWIVLFFDTYERTGPVLDVWLRDLLLGDGFGDVPLNVLVVLSGQGRLATACWGDWLDQIAATPLDVFTEEEARTLLTAKGVTEQRTVEAVLRLSGRLPVLLDMLAQTRPAGPEAVADPSETAVERFLKWEPDLDRRAAVLACALSRDLDEDVHRTLVPGAGPGEYAWLRALPFVSDRAGRHRYHDVVRAPMLRLQRVRSPERWRRGHTLLADEFRRRREELEERVPDPEERWADPDWRGHRLNETYHQLCADPPRALPGALLETVLACDHGPSTLHRWVEMLGWAAADTDSAPIGGWARRLARAAGQESGTAAALTLLLDAPGLDATGRALTHTVRGDAYRFARDLGRALADHSAALTLDPGLARAWLGSSATRLALGDYSEAHADVERAMALGRDDATVYARRGHLLVYLSRFEEALADLDRAVTLDPRDAWAVAERGQAHRCLGHYAEAVADHTRAVELDPGYAWAYAERSRSHRSLGDDTRALADLDRAIAIQPDYSWAFGERSRVHSARGDHAAALADLDRAIRHEPEYAWAFGERARVRTYLGHWASAYADYARAVELDPEYAWAHADRGRLATELGRYAAALADLDRALAIRPDYAWAFAQRGEIHRLRGDLGAALADLDRAVGLAPGHAGHHADRGYVLHCLGRDEEAVEAFDRSAAVGGGDVAWALGHLGMALGALGRHPEAVAACRENVERHPGRALAVLGLVIALRRAGEGEAVEADAADERLTALCAAGTAGDAGAAGEPDAWGELLVVHCARGEWTAAGAALDRLLDAARLPRHVHDVRGDLGDVARVLGLDGERLAPLLRRLEAAAERLAPDTPAAPQASSAPPGT
ncbi:ATP-binding protein [Streptomyces avicenniae]|uniref:ATP-binding protein n=1 Tax=Streptomyces avicenniae TaxID=500153 RepID=UPI00069BF58D|nr:ATP-binding protein [Streptomyces avicenniae]